MKNVNVCSERKGKKYILKYTFIQSLCKIKQQNWSALSSTLAPPPPSNLSHCLLTFCSGHHHDDSNLARCHLSLDQKLSYYGIWFIWQPWAKRFLEECKNKPIHSRVPVRYTSESGWVCLGEVRHSQTTNNRLIKSPTQSQASPGPSGSDPAGNLFYDFCFRTKMQLIIWGALKSFLKCSKALKRSAGIL